MRGYEILEAPHWAGVNRSQRGELILRLYPLSRHAKAEAGEQGESFDIVHSNSRYRSYRLADQLVRDSVEIRLGPGGLVCWILPDSVVLLDWKRGAWLGKHICKPKVGIKMAGSD